MTSVWDREADPTGAPDYLILERISENTLPHWAREGVYFPPKGKRRHHLKPVKGLEKIDFGDRPVVHYAYLSVSTLFDPALTQLWRLNCILQRQAALWLTGFLKRLSHL